jgi:hypothetical protein
MKPHKNQSAHHVKQSRQAVASSSHVSTACRLHKTHRCGASLETNPVKSGPEQNRDPKRAAWDASSLVQQGRPRWCSMATTGGSHPDNSTQTQQHTPSTPSAGQRHTHAWDACLAVSVSNEQCNRNGSRAVRLHKPTTSKQYSALLWGNPWSCCRAHTPTVLRGTPERT